MKANGHKPCRPPEVAHDVERWTGRRWIADDGKPGLVFRGMAGYFPMVWYTECRGGFPCMCGDAMRSMAELHGAANGRVVPAVPRRSADRASQSERQR